MAYKGYEDLKRPERNNCRVVNKVYSISIWLNYFNHKNPDKFVAQVRYEDDGWEDIVLGLKIYQRINGTYFVKFNNKRYSIQVGENWLKKEQCIIDKNDKDTN